MTKEYLYKDKILALLLTAYTDNSISLYSDNMINDIGVNTSYLIYLLDDLSEKNYITIRKTSGVSNPLSGRLCHIEHKGIAFINAGGFTKIARKERLLTCWTIVKTVALSLNSLLILGVAIWGVRVQIEANSIKEVNSPSEIKNSDNKVKPFKKPDTLIVRKKHN